MIDQGSRRLTVGRSVMVAGEEMTVVRCGRRDVVVKDATGALWLHTIQEVVTANTLLTPQEQRLTVATARHAAIAPLLGSEPTPQQFHVRALQVGCLVQELRAWHARFSACPEVRSLRPRRRQALLPGQLPAEHEALIRQVLLEGPLQEPPDRTWLLRRLAWAFEQRLDRAAPDVAAPPAR